MNRHHGTVFLFSKKKKKKSWKGNPYACDRSRLGENCAETKPGEEVVCFFFFILEKRPKPKTLDDWKE